MAAAAAARTSPSCSPLRLFLLLPPLLILIAILIVHCPSVVVAASSAGALGEFPDSRGEFPDGFLFGTASSSYQYEGAAREGGKGPSIWDNFTHSHPEKIKDGRNGDVAVDSYHRYKEDVKLMKELGMDGYRFSISWARILPNGRVSGGINRRGVRYYNDLINELLSNGIRPFVTLFHWDSPQALEDEYGGFLSPRIVKDFEEYARVCFREFGDRVKHWMTFNEPHSFASEGYGKGNRAPGRCSPWLATCNGGDSAREPYLVAHHILLSHAQAVRIYRSEFEYRHNGEIGIVLNIHWFLPYSNTVSDENATQRSIDFMLGWYMDPLTNGNYPPIMKELLGDRLPKFTSEQSEMLKNSFDFIGFNYYTTYYAYDIPPPSKNRLSMMTDAWANKTGECNGILIGPLTPSNWLYIYPEGLRDGLVYLKNKYNDPVIYITENGVDEMHHGDTSLEEALEDNIRVYYFREHLRNVHRAIRDGVKVRGYFAWSLLDNFEWDLGFLARFGIVYVDYSDGLRRHPKSSALWFRRFLRQLPELAAQ